MVKIKAFRSIRPNPQLVDKVASLPYDVLDSKEALQLGKDNPYSFLHIDKAEIDLDQTISPYDPVVYQKAAENLQTFLENDWLQQEDKPALYLYELTMNGRRQLGIVTCTAIQDYLSGKIKKHEFTREEKEIDRINHSDACDANTSPIFLTYRGNENINQVTSDWVNTHQPIYDFTHFYDVDHRVWVVDDEKVIATLVQQFETNVSSLYIADGHHRTESAVKVGNKRIGQYGDNEQAEYQHFLSVLFPKDELFIYDYNRVLNIDITDSFMTQIQEFFVVHPTNKGAESPANNQSFTMYLDHQWYHLTLKDSLINENTPLLESLNASLFQSYVCEKIVGITNIRTDNRIDFIGGIKGLNELESLVDRKKFTVAFALYPATMDELLAVADANDVMPPKSTWFEPKLLSGLFLHDLESD